MTNETKKNDIVLKIEINPLLTTVNDLFQTK